MFSLSRQLLTESGTGSLNNKLLRRGQFAVHDRVEGKTVAVVGVKEGKKVPVTAVLTVEGTLDDHLVSAVTQHLTFFLIQLSKF